MFYMTKEKQKTKGFSLIELVVVIAIVMIMTALLLVVSSEDRTKRELETSSRQLAVGLRQAQNFALTGKKQGTRRPCDFSFVSTGSAYRVDYTYYEPGDPSGDIDGNGVTDCGDTPLLSATAVGATDLAHGVVVATVPEVVFEVPFGKISTIYESPITTPITFIAHKAGVYYAVCLSPSGRVDEVGDVTHNGGASYTCP